MVTIVIVGILAGAIVAALWAAANPDIGGPDDPEEHHTRDWDDDGWSDDVDDHGRPIRQKWTFDDGWRRL